MACDPYGDDNPTNKWPVILTAITTTTNKWHGDPYGDHNHDQHLARDPYGDHNHGLSLFKLFLLLLTHDVTYFRTGPLSAGAAIDRFNIHFAEVSTLYPHYGTPGLALPFRCTNGVPTKLSYCHDTLPATPTQQPLRVQSWWPRAYQRHQRPPSWQKHKRSQMGTKRCLTTTTGTQGLCPPT